MISIRKIRKIYGDLVALDEISLEIEKGMLFGLLGPNGAGKTTLLKILTTLIQPTSGFAYIAGYNVLTEGKKVRRLMGVVFQENNLDRHLTARENLILHAKMYGLPKAQYLPRIQELLRLTGLSTRQDEYPHRFSGGMQRRLAVARALVHKPKVLFLDEPTSGLDPQARRVLWDYLLSLKGEATIFLTTHHMEEAEELCDRIVIVDRGKILADGTSGQLKTLVEDSKTYEVEFKSRGEHYLRLITGLSFVESCRGENGRLVISLTHAEAVRSLITLLDLGDIRYLGIKEPSLEEVYLHLTGRDIREC